ncbi:protoglobin domain-containing protein, partial [Tistlia consotensis]
MHSEPTETDRLQFLEIDAATRACLREARPWLEQELPAILDGFYLHLARFPETARFFPTAQKRDLARNAQLAHWRVILEARFDRTYLDSVRRVGQAHHRLGLAPRLYIGGYCFLLTRLLAAISERVQSRWSGACAARRSALLAAITKAALLDMDCAISVYLEAGQQEKLQLLDRLAGSFERDIGGVVETLTASVGELHDTAHAMSETTALGRDRATSVARTAEQATGNVTTVAAAAEEMSHSVREIS